MLKRNSHTVIPQPIAGDGVVHLLHENGDTMDIITGVGLADKYGVAYVEDFARDIKEPDLYNTFANVFEYVQDYIPYRQDPKGKQYIQLPGALFNNRAAKFGGTGNGGDCKSYAIFIASVLKAQGNYNFVYRFTSQKAGTDFHHVYIVAQIADDAYIAIDPTIPNGVLGDELPFQKVLDVPPSADSGQTYPEQAETQRVGDFVIKLGNGIGATQAELDNDYWEKEHEYLARNIRTLSEKLRAECMVDVGKKWEVNMAVFAESDIEIFQPFKKYWNELLRYGSCMLYEFWNAPFLSFYAAQPGVQHPSIIPFPAYLSEQKLKAKKYYDNLIELGVSKQNLEQLCNLSTWNTYGISMDYMLYRCYCKALYGQEFIPRPGVPFFRNDMLIANGASLQVAFALLLCMPAQGGLGRPWKEPYWTGGGWLMGNGASKEEIDSWMFVGEKMGGITRRPGDLMKNGQVVPGIIINDGAGVEVEYQQYAMEVWNTWRKGEMVVIPSAPNPNSNKINLAGAAVGFGIPEIIGIVVAIVSAISVIGGIISKVLKQVQHPDLKNAPIPPKDFNFSYYTPDGCYIAYCTEATGCAGNVAPNQKVKICDGKIVETNVNLNDPNNQPMDPGNYFGGGGAFTKKKVFTWAGVGLIGAAVVTGTGK